MVAWHLFGHCDMVRVLYGSVKIVHDSLTRLQRLRVLLRLEKRMRQRSYAELPLELSVAVRMRCNKHYEMHTCMQKPVSTRTFRDQYASPIYRIIYLQRLRIPCG